MYMYLFWQIINNIQRILIVILLYIYLLYIFLNYVYIYNSVNNNNRSIYGFFWQNMYAIIMHKI